MSQRPLPMLASSCAPGRFRGSGWFRGSRGPMRRSGEGRNEMRKGVWGPTGQVCKGGERLDLLTPGSCKCDLIWRQGLCGCDPGKRWPRWTGTSPNPRPWALTGRGEFGYRYIWRGPYEDAGGDWNDVSTDRGMAKSCQKPEETHGAGSSPELQREHGPADALISGFCPEPSDNRFLLF